MKYEKLSEYSNEKFRRVTGVKRATFEKMTEILRKAYAEKHRRRGRMPKLSIEDLLLATLEYLREYWTYAHIVASYGIAESNIYRGIICLAFANGKKHDFQLFKDSRVHVRAEALLEADTGYQGLAQMHANSLLPKKRSKNHPLTKQQRKENREISSRRIFVEHAIRFVKRFRILSEPYRNRRKRFSLRFSLIAGICNFDRCV